MTDLLTPEMEAMLKISGALKLAQIPDKRPKPEKTPKVKPAQHHNMPPDALRATETGDSVKQVLQYLENAGEPLTAINAVLEQPEIELPKRGRGRPKKGDTTVYAPPISKHKPAGVLRRQHMHEIMAGNWEIVGEINHELRDIVTVCGYKAKHAFILKNLDTGREILVGWGAVVRYTNLTPPKNDKQGRQAVVSAAFI